MPRACNVQYRAANSRSLPVFYDCPGCHLLPSDLRHPHSHRFSRAFKRIRDLVETSGGAAPPVDEVKSCAPGAAGRGKGATAATSADKPAPGASLEICKFSLNCQLQLLKILLEYSTLTCTCVARYFLGTTLRVCPTFIQVLERAWVTPGVHNPLPGELAPLHGPTAKHRPKPNRRQPRHLANGGRPAHLPQVRSRYVTVLVPKLI